MGGRNSTELHSNGVNGGPPPKPTKEVNILILGETGVGKSTWINGIPNYLTCRTLEVAEQNEYLHVIPMSFTMTSMDYEEIVVSTGNDNNEDSKAGNSATQWPKTYTFQLGQTLIRLIDTPGIGDVRGVEQDKENFKRILSHLSNLDEIHGICILLKPNSARLTVAFQFCVKELFTHFHVDASKNIVFCFTNARSTFYRPGDTLAPLKRLLADNKNVTIPISRDTMYCMDNEAIRFLAAAKQGVYFDDADRKNFSVSWKKSVQETNRLFNYISTRDSHKISDTISLNHSRQVITELTKPLAEIYKNIQDNIAVMNDKEEEMKDVEVTRSDLRKKLYVRALDLKIVQLDYPQTMCGSSKCMEVVQDKNGQKVAVYREPCCSFRWCSGRYTRFPNGTKNQPELKRCREMEDINGQVVCKSCGCSWVHHLKQTYKVLKVNTTVEDPHVKRQMKHLMDKRKAIGDFVHKLRHRIFELKREADISTKVSAELAGFLQKYAIAPYNDAMAEYLDHLICVEKGKIAAGRKKKLEELMNMKSQYAKEAEILEKAMKRNASTTADNITPKKMEVLVNKLCALPINGQKFKSIIQVVDGSIKRDEMNTEFNITSTPSSSPPPLLLKPMKEVNAVEELPRNVLADLLLLLIVLQLDLICLGI